jgi:hypothetical protein
VLRTVDFDDELRRHTENIDRVRPERHLATKLHAQPAAAQLLPEKLLRGGLPPPELTREVALRRGHA